MAIIINCDMGEAYGLYRCGDDEGIMPLIHVANVACGFHASDPSVMRRTVRLAKQHGVKVGAHPSFPDLQGFGRREMKMGRDELVACIIYQVGALKGFLDAEGMPLNHIKPHGALYGAASRDPAVAEAIAEAVGVFGVPVMGMAGTAARDRLHGAAGSPSSPNTTSTSTIPTRARSSSRVNMRRPTRPKAPGGRFAWRRRRPPRRSPASRCP